MDQLLQQKITYFDSSNKQKELIAKSENDRLKMEIELNKLINSEETVARKKATQLKAYYQKLCDNEAKSILRNQTYLNDIQRVDSQFSQLEIKLERLTNLKKECEIYLRTTHPKFTHDNRIGTNQELLEDIVNDKDYAVHQGINLIASNLQKIKTLNDGRPTDTYRSENFTNRYPENANQYLTKSHNFQEQTPQINSPVNRSFDENKLIQSNLSPKSNKSRHNSAISNLMPRDVRSPQEQIVQPKSENLNHNEQIDENEEELEIKNEFIKKLISTTMAEYERNNESNMVQNKTDTQVNFGGLNTTGNILLKEYEQEVQRQDTDMNGTIGTVNSMGMSALMTATGMGKISSENDKEQKPRVVQQRQESFKARSSINSPISEESTTDLDALRKQNDFEDSSTKSSLRQELNLKSLYRLLDYIELEMQHTIHPEKYYRQVAPHYKNKLEIIKYANEGSGALNTMDSAAISMVIQDQLPNVIRKYTTNGCLFTPDLLGYSVNDINENGVRNHLSNATDKDLWEHLFKHFLGLRRMGILDSASIAEIFAPALVGDNLSGKTKASKFLEKIIIVSASQMGDPLGESMSFTETSMNKSLQLASSSKLKETSAYQQFIMGSTFNSNKSTLKEKNEYSDDDDDENDDIDALVAPKSAISTGKSVFNPVNNTILISPRKSNGDFDFSQVSSTSEAPKKSSKSDKLKNIRSTNDKKKIPVHLRDFEDSEDSEVDTDDDVTEIKTQKTKSLKSDNDFDFYN